MAERAPTAARGRRGERSRRELAAIAIDQFQRKGFAATTVEEIAEAADYSPRTFFRQFASKEDVVFFDLPDILSPLEALLEPGGERRAAWPAVCEIVISNATLWEKAEPEFAESRTRLFHTEPALYRRFLEIASECEIVIARVFAAERGTDAATDVRAQVLATAVVGACRSAFRVWLAGADGTVAARLRDALDAIESGFELPGPAM